MKIGLITTLETNIGDDFIREGILHVCRQIFGHDGVEFIMINKHLPYTLYPKWHPIYWTRFVPRKRHLVSRLFSRLFSWVGFSVFEKCDAIIQCGAPVYWYDCHKAEWAEVFWRGIAGRLSKKIPVLNIAAGSCYPWERIPDRLESKKDAEYIQRIYEYCRLTVVRDTKSQEILKTLNCEPSFLPCSAFLAAMPYQHLEQHDEIVFINYMEGGSHYDFDQHIDGNRWATAMRDFILMARKKYKLAFICHNQKEFDLAGGLVPDLPRFFPRTVEEYFNIAVWGKAGIFNRMHASVGFAGLGIPSMAIGADTRMLMVDNIDLPITYVKDATTDVLLEALENLVKNRNKQASRLLKLQKETLKAYISELSSVLK